MGVYAVVREVAGKGRRTKSQAAQSFKHSWRAKRTADESDAESVCFTVRSAQTSMTGSTTSKRQRKSSFGAVVDRAMEASSEQTSKPNGSNRKFAMLGDACVCLYGGKRGSSEKSRRYDGHHPYLRRLLIENTTAVLKGKELLAAGRQTWENKSSGAIKKEGSARSEKDEQAIMDRAPRFLYDLMCLVVTQPRPRKKRKRMLHSRMNLSDLLHQHLPRQALLPVTARLA